MYHIINSLYFIFYNKYLVASLTFYYLWHRFNQMLETSRDDFALCWHDSITQTLQICWYEISLISQCHKGTLLD